MERSTVIMLGMLFIASGFLLVIDGVEGKTITVDMNGGADFTKIQDAINSSSDGDIIRVWEGTYQENVVVNKTVSLIGNGSELTTIDGGGVGDVVTITADGVNLSGFRVTGSKSQGAGIRMQSDNIHAFENNCSNNNYGIYLRYSSNTTLTNSTFSQNYYGIYIYHSSNSTIMSNTCSLNNYYGIRLDDSSDCTITNNNCSNNSIGIYLLDSINSTIKNNSCSSNNQHGIFISFSSDSTIEYNTCSSNNNYGIFIYRSNYSPITNNTCSSNYRTGIYLESSRDSTIGYNNCSSSKLYGGIQLAGSSNSLIEYNTCSLNSNYGILLDSSRNNTLTNNVVSDNWLGVSLFNSNDVTLRRNTMSNNSRNFDIRGDSLGHFDQTIDTSNTVDGKPIYYIVEKQNETFDIDVLKIGSIACISCDNITVRNASDLTKNGFGVFFYDTNNSFIQDIMADSLSFGIDLRSSNNNILTNNTASNNAHGIHLINSNNNILNHNTALNNTQGIHLINSNENTLLKNTILENGRGMYLRDSSYINLINNTIMDNTHGIYLSRSNYFSVMNNTCEDNGNGIYIDNSNGNAFTGNTISGNRVGIFIQSSSRTNTASMNNIYNNTGFGLNASKNNKIEIDARNNWWGDSSGPYDPTNNSSGKGDNVTSNVIFKPWLIIHRNSKPKITYVSMENNSIVRNTVEIIVTAHDNDGPINSVEISVNGSSWIQMEQFPFDWSYRWNTRDRSDGETEIKIRCYDGEDNSDEITLIIMVKNSNDENDQNDDEDDGHNVNYELYLLLVILILLITILISVISKVVDVGKY